MLSIYHSASQCVCFESDDSGQICKAKTIKEPWMYNSVRFSTLIADLILT